MLREDEAKTISEAVRFVRRERKAVKTLLKKVKPQDFPLIIERLPKDEGLQLILLLPDDVIKEFIVNLPSEILRDVVASMDRNRLTKILTTLPADELSDLINKLPHIQRKTLLKEMPLWKLEEIRPLLAYPPDTAGGLMTNRIPIFFMDVEVGKAIEEYNIQTKFESYDTNHNIYVVDGEGKLLGYIGVKDLLTTPRNKKLKEVMEKPMITVEPYTDQEDVAKMITKYDLLEFPVVDKNGRLLGVITIDDVVDVIIKESSEDIEKFGGLAKKVTAPYLTAKISELVKKRVVWLIFLCLLESITATIIASFEKVILATVALTFFIPLLISIGGNSGSQSSAFVVRALATGDVTVYDALKVLLKEAITSLTLGLTLTPVIFLLGFFLTGKLVISVLLSSALLIIVFLACIMGGMLPIVAAKLKIDPATISSPFITTTTDVVGLFIYFSLAMLILQYMFP